MSNVNSFDFIGRLGKDPVSAPTTNGGTGYYLTIAVEKTTLDRHSGERRTIVDWIPLAIFRDGMGKYAMDHLRKGDQIYVSGSVRSRKALDENGQEYSAPSFRVNVINRLQQARANKNDAHDGQSQGYQDHGHENVPMNYSHPQQNHRDLPPNY